MRGGLKSAGKNALVGGVLLAAIEGLNIAVSRIVMPMLEKRSNEDIVIDMMEPPVDPMRPRASRNQTSFRQSPSAPVPVGGGKGFDIDSVDQFQADSWDSTISNNKNSSIEDNNETSKPFWKVW